MAHYLGVKGGNVIVSAPSLIKQSKEIALTVTGTNWTTTRAVGVFTADSNGVWRLVANIEGTLTAAGGILLTMPGVTFKAGVLQAITAAARLSGNFTAIKANYTSAGASTFGVEVASGNLDTLDITIDVELDAEPTWASLGTTASAALEGVMPIVAYIPFGQAGMPNEVKESSVGGPITMTTALTVYQIATIATPGIGTWEISGQATAAYGAENAYLKLGISTTTASHAGLTLGKDLMQYAQAAGFSGGNIGPFNVVVTSGSTSFFLNASSNTTNYSNVYGFLRMKRLY